MWHVAMDLCKYIYKLTKGFPKDELYGMVSQMRRCAVSVPSNIAEGFARKGFGDKKYLMSVAIGSLAELETQIELSNDFEYIKKEEKERVISMINCVGKMVSNFLKKSVD
ncbi:MAG: four helix bundle protein [Deltaproteobacteria bacterium]|nr:four helix bundle protein [Deltaproteobacteria bacterium]